MTSERQPPDAILASTNLAGAVTDIDDDPDSPDANWLTVIEDGADTMVRVSFPTPTGNPTTGAGLQEFRWQVRRTNKGGGNDPTYSLHLYEDGSDLGEIGSGTVVSETGEVIFATWNAASLGTPDGSLVEAYLYGTVVKKHTVEIGAVEWNVEYDIGPVHEGAGQSDGVATAAASAVKVFAAISQSDGTSTASASGSVERTGRASSEGIATAAVAAELERSGAGSSHGVAAAEAIGNVDFCAITQSDGTSAASATGSVEHRGEGQAVGLSSVTASGGVGRTGICQSDGSSTATGTAALDCAGKGQADGASMVTANAARIYAGAALCEGASSATATGELEAVAGAAVSIATSVSSANAFIEGEGISVVCRFNGACAHALEDLTEHNACGFVSFLLDFCNPEIEWGQPETHKWVGSGGRIINILGVG